MSKEDIAQVSEIDREAFYFQWPPPNFRRELENRLARYLVVCDDSKTVAAKPATGNLHLMSRIKQWLDPGHSATDKLSVPRQEYIVGFAGIWVVADEAHLTNIAVRHDYQRQGIGELLLIATIDLAKELKADFMTLEVRASNTAAQSLYRKYGFTQVGIRRGYYHDSNEDAIIMSTENMTTASFQRKFQQRKQAHARKWGGIY